MAKKRNATPAEPPRLGLVGAEVENPHPSPSLTKAQKMTMSPKDLVTPEYICQLLRHEAFDCNWMGDHMFLAVDHQNRKLSVQVKKDYYLICLSMPLAFHKDWTKARKLDWINDRMVSFPCIRLYLREYGDGVVSMEYHYLNGFEENHFLGIVHLTMNIIENIYKTDAGEALRMSF